MASVIVFKKLKPIDMSLRWVEIDTLRESCEQQDLDVISELNEALIAIDTISNCTGDLCETV